VLTKRAERMKRVCSTQIAGPLPNAWLGVSVESPAYYGRIHHLQRTPAAVRFLSCEPLLAALPDLPLEGIDWVIVGAESGPGARPMKEPWVEEIIAQCQAAGASVFVKQLGTAWARGRSSDRKGGRMADWPRHLRIRELPEPGDAGESPDHVAVDIRVGIEPLATAAGALFVPGGYSGGIAGAPTTRHPAR
jgi:protein gp37